jgi:pimeloyl-ACP methyl ester carboxylesterase
LLTGADRAAFDAGGSDSDGGDPGAALNALAGRIVVAGGRDSRDFYPYHCAERLAEELRVPLAELPGHHAGMIQYPAEFAAQLRELLPLVR